jgi:hypothetical protein
MRALHSTLAFCPTSLASSPFTTSSIRGASKDPNAQQQRKMSPSLHAIERDVRSLPFYSIKKSPARLARVEQQAFRPKLSMKTHDLKAAPGAQHRHFFQVLHRNWAPPNGKNRKRAQGPTGDRQRVCVDDNPPQLKEEKPNTKDEEREREPSRWRVIPQDEISKPSTASQNRSNQHISISNADPLARRGCGCFGRHWLFQLFDDNACSSTL